MRPYAFPISPTSEALVEKPYWHSSLPECKVSRRALVTPLLLLVVNDLAGAGQILVGSCSCKH